MPTYEVTSPDGRTFEVTAPDGASQQDVLAYAQANFEKLALKKKDISLGERFKDVGAGVVSGVGALAQLPGQLSGLAGLTELDDTGLQGAGKRLQKYGEEMKSSGLKAREEERAAKIKEAEKSGQLAAAGTAFAETIKDPALLMSFLAEQAPQLVVPFGAAKGASAVAGAKALGRGLAAEEAALAAGQAGTKAAIGTGAVQQGADIGAGAYENIYKELIGQGANPDDAKQSALNLARASGASGAIISLLAQRLPGASSLEKSLAGVPGTGGRVMGAVTSGLGEGLGEVTEETGGRFTQNLAMRNVKPEQSLTEGLGETAGMAAIGGVGMGGISGALQRQASERAAIPSVEPEQTPEQEPLALGMNAPFVPVSLPDGSVANTPAELDAYRQQQQFGENLLAQPADVQGPSFADMTRAGAQAPSAMAGFTGAPTANVSMMEQVRAAREAETTAAEKQLKAEIKRIQSTDFNANPIVNQQIKDRMLANLGVTPAQVKSVVVEPTVKEELTPEELALAEAREPLPGEGVSPDAGLTPAEARAQKRQIEKANAQNKAAPAYREEINQLAKDRAAAQKALDEASKNKGSLFNELKGKIKVQPGAFGLSDINMDESLAKQLVNKEGKGALLEDMVADGLLDEYLTTPHNSPSFDAQFAVQEIADKLAKKDYRSTIASAEMRAAQEERDRLDRELDDLKSMPDANVALGQAAQEQAGYEGLPTEQLVAQAQQLGIDTEAIAQDVARQTEGMTTEQYHGAARNALISAINGAGGVQSIELASVSPVEKNKNGAFAFTSATKAEVQMEKDLSGKSIFQAAQYLVDKAPNAFYKFVGKRILEKLNRMQSEGVILNFKVAGGDRRPVSLYAANGLNQMAFAKDGRPMSFSVTLNGAPIMENQNGYPSGMSYKTLMHELLHTCTQAEIKFLNYKDANHPAVREMIQLYNKVAEEYKAQRAAGTLPDFLVQFNKGHNNALSSVDEMLTWSMTDERMQKWMDNIKVGEKTLFTKIVELIRSVMGIAKPYETALERLVRTTEQIIAIDSQTMADGVKKAGYSYGPKEGPKRMPKEQQSLFSQAAQAMMEEETKELRLGKEEKAPTPTAAGKEVLDILDAVGRGAKPADPTYRARIEAGWNNAVDNPKATIQHFKKLGSRKISEFKTKTFSSDAALQDAYEEAIVDAYKNQDEVIGLLIQASTSQANHADGVAGVALEMGTVEFDEQNQKWKGKETADRFATLSDVLQKIANKYGYNQEQMNRVYHTALETRQTEQMAEEDKIIHLSDEQLAAGRELFRKIPELNDAVKVWNGIRKNIMKVMVDGGMYSQADADFLLSNTAYVPMYREMDPDSAGGPVDSMRGLRAAADKARKGSMRTVNDIFDNQVRWVEFAVSRAVKAHKARTLADAAEKEGLAEKFNSKVVPPSTMPNVVKIWRDGKEEYFSMADPLFMDAFTGLQSVSIPMFKIAAKFANFLRQSIVMYPLFSAAQVTQDSVAAIFTSGLKPQFALRIPAYAVKELIRTMQGKSRYHEELKKYAAVGVRDVNSTVVRMEAEERFGIKGPPTLKRAIMQKLNSFAMAADNSVRQATYQAALEAGLSQKEALEKSFEIFNVRRRGTSKALAFAGQVIPFFPAYLAAQNVAFRTLSGQGTSPSQRAEALKTLAATTASVMVLSMLYAMMNGDDEDYLKKPAVQRDRLLMIPGTGGLSVPLRADVFLFPKILAEHTYLMLTDKGYEDGRKFRDSMYSALSSSLTSPTVVPQVVKPLAEVALNYNFFQQRPLIGTFQQKLETERQFTESTSEFSKMLGQTGLIAPINADHLIRGMFGSFGGLALWMTNDLIASANPSGQRSDISLQDAIATMPGTSGFVSKSYESALKKDFYTLKEDVDRAVNTMNDLKKNAPQEIGGFLEKEENVARLGLQRSVNAIGERLSNTRAAIKQISQSDMSGAEKQERIKALREAEEQMLQAVDVKKLRELGKI